MVAPLALYDYLASARTRVLDASGALAAEQQARVFPIGVGSLNATVAHVMMAEWFYVRRMTQRAVPVYAEWPHRYEEPPVFAAARAFWERQAEETRRALREMADWNATITYQSLPEPGEAVRTIATSPAKIFTQLVLHEVHHRSQMMAMLRQLGSPVEDLDFSAMTYAKR